MVSEAMSILVNVDGTNLQAVELRRIDSLLQALATHTAGARTPAFRAGIRHNNRRLES